MAQLELDGVIQRYGKQIVVNGVSFRLESGRIACLLGPSGCGKTTLLRCIAGFEPVTGGEIRLHGKLVGRKDLQVPPERRQIGMVFQDYALFPHLTVARNIAFGLKPAASKEANERVRQLLETVGLSGLGEKFPHELSGGQQQRVALARALAPRPELLLLDEPFSNLDVGLRERLSMELRDILKREKATAIMVTHDQHEAFAMADEIGVMYQGQIQQWGTPHALYHEPANRFVADFIGQGSLHAAQIDGERQIASELGTWASDDSLQCNETGANLTPGASIDLLIRPDEVLLDDASPVRAHVINSAFRGDQTLHTLRLPSGSRILSLQPSEIPLAAGDSVGVRLALKRINAFKAPDDCGKLAPPGASPSA